MASDDGLSPAQAAAFARDGYLVVRAALAAPAVAALLAEARRLLATLALADHPMTRFTTGGGDGRRQQHVGDEYFLSSGDAVRFFFEEAAFDAAGRLAVADARLAVNKMGHGLHRRSAPFAALLRRPHAASADDASASAASADAASADDASADAASASDASASDAAASADAAAASAAVARAPPAAVARALGYRDPRVLQSMVICKPPRLGAAVPPHQDSAFLYTSPPSALGFWYALEDAAADNGGLAVLPGSHRWAPVAARLVRCTGPDFPGTEMVANDGPRFPAGCEPADADGPDGPDARDADAAYVPLDARAGDLVLIHGNLLHKSDRNTSDKGRIIYTFHIIEADGTTYDERNWLQPPDGGFTRLYDAEHGPDR